MDVYLYCVRRFQVWELIVRKHADDDNDDADFDRLWRGGWPMECDMNRNEMNSVAFFFFSPSASHNVICVNCVRIQWVVGITMVWSSIQISLCGAVVLLSFCLLYGFSMVCYHLEYLMSIYSSCVCVQNEWWFGFPIFFPPLLLFVCENTLKYICRQLWLDILPHSVHLSRFLQFLVPPVLSFLLVSTCGKRMVTIWCGMCVCYFAIKLIC